MAIQLNTLFNDKRRGQIQDSLKRGEAIVFLSRRIAPDSMPPEQAANRNSVPAILTGKDELRRFNQGVADGILVSAVENGDIDSVKNILSDGADPNADDHHLQPFRRNECRPRKSALQIARDKGYTEIAKLLVAFGAKG